MGKVYIQLNGSIGWLIFDNESRRNAISVSMWQQIPKLAAELADNPQVRVVVLRGAGETSFVSGADISEFRETRIGENARGYDELNSAAYRALLDLKKPTIAMIHGHCIGGGTLLALTCDIRYASTSAVFAVPAAKLGLVYPIDGIRLLTAATSPARAKEILFTGTQFGANAAAEAAIVNLVVDTDDLEPRVRALANGIADNAPLTLQGIKIAMAQLSRPPCERDMSVVDRALEACFHSEDYAEGVDAFLNKRPAKFNGR